MIYASAVHLPAPPLWFDFVIAEPPAIGNGCGGNTPSTGMRWNAVWEPDRRAVERRLAPAHRTRCPVHGTVSPPRFCDLCQLPFERGVVPGKNTATVLAYEGRDYIFLLGGPCRWIFFARAREIRQPIRTWW